MDKLPVSERPPMEMLRKQLHQKISPQYRQFFVEDVQNDCACNIESYRNDSGGGEWWRLSDIDCLEKVVGPKVEVPMLSDISDQSILMLLRKLCDTAGQSLDNDTVHHLALVHPNISSEQCNLIRSRLFRCSYPSDNYGNGIVTADFVPGDTLYLFPEPEFLGVITVNLKGFGAFGLSKNITHQQVR